MLPSIAYPLLRAPVADGRVETAGAVSHRRAGFSFMDLRLRGQGDQGQAAGRAGAGSNGTRAGSRLLLPANVRASCNGTNTVTGTKHMNRSLRGHSRINWREVFEAVHWTAKDIARAANRSTRHSKRYRRGEVPIGLFDRLGERLLPVIARSEAHLRRLRIDLEKALHGGESAEISRRGALGAGDRRRAGGSAAVARGLSAVPADRTGETEVTE